MTSSNQFSSSKAARILGIPNISTAVNVEKDSSNLIDTDYLSEPWHSELFMHEIENEESTPTWRLKDRMKTVGVALVACLNIGTDPPDIIKPASCARRECWLDTSSCWMETPSPAQKEKLHAEIGNALQRQYEKWQSKAKYKQCLDPTFDDLRRLCMNLRKGARTDRLLFHYNGHGVPRPTDNGEIWVFAKHYTHYMPVSISDLRLWFGGPSIYVLDCSGAGALIEHFLSPVQPEFDPSKVATGGGSYDPPEMFLPQTNAGLLDDKVPEDSTFVLAACRKDDVLPFNPQYPADIFTSCLTTPISIAVRWFILQNPQSIGISPDIADSIPGDISDRKTPRGELNWVFTAITDTIAWDTLPPNMFQKLFRQDLLVASMFRNFLLAKRIMKSLNCYPQSHPPLPDTSTHRLWQAWDLAVESFITSWHKGPQIVSEPRSLTNFFFSDHLSAFEIWLDFGGRDNKPPLHLPILLQVLLSQAHRLRALQLLRRYLAMGPRAVNFSLVVGIFPYIMKLIQSPGAEIRKVLVSIWASILDFDQSCRIELIKDKSHGYFMQYLTAKDTSSSQRSKSAFILAEICNKYKEGQQICLQQGLHRSCSSLLAQKEFPISNTHKKWVALCLYKLCEDNIWAKYLLLTESGYPHLFPMLINEDPCVRSAASLALGEVFGASDLRQASSGVGKTKSQTELSTFELCNAELLLALQILESCTDGSALVRRESVIALSKFVALPAHLRVMKRVVQFLRISQKVRQSSTEKDETRPYRSFVLDSLEMTSLTEEVSSFLADDLKCNDASSFSSKPDNMGSISASAATYIRIWLALLELEEKEAHPLVYETVRAITRAVKNSCSRKFSSGKLANVSSSLNPNLKDEFEKSNSINSSVPQFLPSGPALSPRRSPSRSGPAMMASEDDIEDLMSDFETEPALKSWLYDWNKKLFMQPDLCYDPLEDPLSIQGSVKLLKQSRHQDLLETKKKMHLTYQDYDKIPDDFDSNHLSLRFDAVMKEKNTATNVPKFEQSVIIHHDKPLSISCMLFHPYSDVLAISDAGSVGIWSIENGSNILNVNCKNSTGNDDSNVTTMAWINGSGDSLLAVGSDDGSMRIWRDLGEEWGDDDKLSLASVFVALPDVAKSNKGSGMVMSWQQSTGSLSVAGNSNTIRLWDLSREQCVRVFHTGSSTCIASISSTTSAKPTFANPGFPGSSDYQSWTWLIAGFGDGHVGVFDERVSSNGGKVNNIRAHNSSWVVSTHLQADAPVAITSCVNGGIKFWDVRTMRVFSTIDASKTKSPITSMNVHNCAPIIALGSPAQFINILSFNGVQLGKIRHHDGFLGQRIGPVSALAFHPTKLMLAAGATDSIISVYSADN